MPLVSVVIPSYNHAAYISAAVQSVLSQSLTDLELIVVDDGSRDESVEILRGFSDKRLHLITQENRGAHAAINRGLAQGSGDYLAILNSDDVYHLDRLEKLANVLERDSALGLVGSYIEVIDQKGKKLGTKKGYRNLEPWLLPSPERSFRAGDDLRAALLTENYLATTSNYLFTRRIFEQVGLFRPLRYAHDWDFALRVAQLSRLALHPEALMQYRVHVSNTISENQAAMIFEICWILAVHLPQQMDDEAWFNTLPLARRMDQLLHSIYTYKCDRVLIGMLLQNLTDHLDQALNLLAPENTMRQQYLAFIAEQLHACNSRGDSEQSQTTQLGKKVIRKLRSLGRLSRG